MMSQQASAARGTIRLTTLPAHVRWLVALRPVPLGGTESPLSPGVFVICGHGNVLGLGQQHRRRAPAMSTEVVFQGLQPHRWSDRVRAKRASIATMGGV